MAVAVHGIRLCSLSKQEVVLKHQHLWEKTHPQASDSTDANVIPVEADALWGPSPSAPRVCGSSHPLPESWVLFPTCPLSLSHPWLNAFCHPPIDLSLNSGCDITSKLNYLVGYMDPEDKVETCLSTREESRLCASDLPPIVTFLL